MEQPPDRPSAPAGSRARDELPEQAADAFRTRILERLRTLPLDATEEALDLLQEGYAHALLLDGASRRTSRELTQVRAEGSDPKAEQQLAERLKTMRTSLRELRTALAALRAWTEERLR